MASDQVDASVLAARAQLSQHFDEYSGEKRGAGWQKLWEKADFLPWDRGIPNPALADLLEQRQDLLGNAELSDNQGRKKVLIPGCGRGVDVLLFKSFGYDAVGLEVSKDAVKACGKHEQEHGQDEIYKSKNEKLGQGTARFVVGDFFSTDWAQGEIPSHYDLIYDYTFFCAIDPSLRPQWASRMFSLLNPGGSLICLEFPTYKSLEAGGPPFGSPPEAYVAHLTHPGEQVSYEEAGDGVVGGSGLERVAHFHPPRTHQMGIDPEGRVRDYIGVWRRLEKYASKST